MNSTVLVTGASGFIGRRLCQVLAESGYEVIGAVRNLTTAQALYGYTKIKLVEIGDIGPRTDWGAVLNGVDVVIHLAARVHMEGRREADNLTEFRRVNVGGVDQLGRAALAVGVKRFIQLSSIKVNGETLGDRLQGDGMDREHRETLQAHREGDRPNPQSAYALSKAEAEQVLMRLAAGGAMECVILRPPLVYGPEVKAGFLRLVHWVGRGLPLPFAQVGNLRSLIYLDNLVDAIKVCVTHSRADGQIFLLSDGEDISTPELIRRIALGLHRPVRLFPVPLPLLQWAGRLSGQSHTLRALVSSQIIDNAKIRRELNWHPPYSLNQGLQATLAWYRKRSE